MPWGIFFVNIVGCFGFGLALTLGEQVYFWDSPQKDFILVAFFGAFTTFSSFIFDCDNLLRNRQIMLFIANIVGQILLGLVGLVMGIKLAVFL